MQTWKINKGYNKIVDVFQIPNYEESSELKSKVMPVRKSFEKELVWNSKANNYKKDKMKDVDWPYILRADDRNLCNIPHTKLSLGHFGGHSRIHAQHR